MKNRKLRNVRRGRKRIWAAKGGGPMNGLFRVVMIAGAGYNAETRDVRNSLPLKAAEKALKELREQYPDRSFRIAAD